MSPSKHFSSWARIIVILALWSKFTVVTSSKDHSDCDYSSRCFPLSNEQRSLIQVKDDDNFHVIGSESFQVRVPYMCVFCSLFDSFRIILADETFPSLCGPKPNQSQDAQETASAAGLLLSPTVYSNINNCSVRETIMNVASAFPGVIYVILPHRFGLYDDIKVYCQDLTRSRLYMEENSLSQLEAKVRNWQEEQNGKKIYMSLAYDVNGDGRLNTKDYNTYYDITPKPIPWQVWVVGSIIFCFCCWLVLFVRFLYMLGTTKKQSSGGQHEFEITPQPTTQLQHHRESPSAIKDDPQRDTVDGSDTNNVSLT